MKQVAVVGLGYVGLPLALLAARKGYQVTGFDVDKIKISKIQKREDPLSDKKISSRA